MITIGDNFDGIASLNNTLSHLRDIQF